jgi:preprotein translocase subunit SecE
VASVSDSTPDSKAVRGPRDGKAEKRTSLPTFYRQVVAELRKVVYPTQEQLVTYFFVVMVFVVVMIALVSVLDLAFGRLVFSIFTGPDQT